MAMKRYGTPLILNVLPQAGLPVKLMTRREKEKVNLKRQIMKTNGLKVLQSLVMPPKNQKMEILQMMHHSQRKRKAQQNLNCPQKEKADHLK